MPIEVEGPDGRVHSFPDNTSNAQINERMSTVYGGGGSLSPLAPQPGQATAASGAMMPGMRAVPDYRDREDWDNIMLTQMFPHAQTIIQNTPGHAYRQEYAKALGKNNAGLEERQRAGTQVLDMLDQLEHTADAGYYQTDARGRFLVDAHGQRIPRSAPPLNDAIGPVDASPTFQRVRASVPLLGSSYESAYNLHNQLMHDIDGLTTAFIASASKGGIQMSDARQKAFEETMGAMMKATTKPEFDKIVADARRIIAGTFNLAPGAHVSEQRSMHAPAPAHQAAPQTSNQRYHNPTTGEVIEWDGRQWQKVN